MCGKGRDVARRDTKGMFAEELEAMMTRMPACCTFWEVVYFECMPPRPKALFSALMYCDRSVPGSTRGMICDAGLSGCPS